MQFLFYLDRSLIDLVHESNHHGSIYMGLGVGQVYETVRKHGKAAQNGYQCP